MSQELAYHEEILNRHEIQRYSNDVEAHHLNLRHLVSEGIIQATEHDLTIDKDAVVQAVERYIIRAIQTCIAKKMATKPATTWIGSWRKRIASFIAGKPVN